MEGHDSGVVVSKLSLDQGPSRGVALCSWAKIVFLSTQVYKWAALNKMLGNPVVYQHSIKRVGIEILQVLKVHIAKNKSLDQQNHYITHVNLATIITSDS